MYNSIAQILSTQDGQLSYQEERKEADVAAIDQTVVEASDQQEPVVQLHHSMVTKSCECQTNRVCTDLVADVVRQVAETAVHVDLVLPVAGVCPVSLSLRPQPLELLRADSVCPCGTSDTSAGVGTTNASSWHERCECTATSCILHRPSLPGI